MDSPQGFHLQLGMALDGPTYTVATRRLKDSRADPVSMISPAYITATLSQVWATTPKSGDQDHPGVQPLLTR
jgi:hypothetical protein